MGNLYEIVKKGCKEKGTTVSRMCLDIGMSKSMMSDLKSGRKKSLSSAALAKISKYLGVTVDYLLGGNDSASSASPCATAAGPNDAGRTETREFLLAVMGITERDIEEERKKKPAPSDEGELNREIIEGYRKLSPEKRRMILDLIEYEYSKSQSLSPGPLDSKDK